MDERFLIVHYFFKYHNAEDSLHTRQFTTTEPFIPIWRFGLGFIFYPKRSNHNGRGILLFPNGFDEENEIKHSIDLYFRIFLGFVSKRSLGQRYSKRNHPIDDLQNPR